MASISDLESAPYPVNLQIMKINILIPTIAIAVSSTSLVSAVNLATYSFDVGSAGATSSSGVTATSFTAPADTNNFGFSPTGQDAFARGGPTASNLADALTDGLYFEVSITPTATTDVRTVIFDHYVANNTGAMLPSFTSNWSLEASLNGAAFTNFGTSTATLATGNGKTLINENFTFALSGFDGLTTADTLRFRLYPHDNSTGATNEGSVLNRFDEFRIDSEVVSFVPEPSSSLLVLLAGGLGLVRRRRA